MLNKHWNLAITIEPEGRTLILIHYIHRNADGSFLEAERSQVASVESASLEEALTIVHDIIHGAMETMQATPEHFAPPT